MENSSDFLKWFNTTPSYFSIGEYFEGDSPPEGSLIELLGLKQADLKAFTQDVLTHLEENDSVKELKAGIRAYSQFQDLLGIVMHEDGPVWNRHYCYYESLVYLRESVVSWLDKNVLAALTLLRPFLELSVLHLYWYLRCESTNYQDFHLWLDGKKGKPPFKNQLDFVFANISSKTSIEPQKSKKLQQFIYNIYKSMSAYNHSPKIDESLVSLSGGVGQVSLGSYFYYLAGVNFLIRQLTYLYMLIYPMAAFPVDRYQKWGFSGPVGLFFDSNNFSIIRAYLGNDNAAQLRKELERVQEITERMEWFESQPNLTPSELENEWAEFQGVNRVGVDAQDKGHRIALQKAHNRAFGWFANYLHTLPDPNKQVSDEMLEKIMDQARNW